MIDKASGRIVVIRPRYIRGLIEHKIIRSRMGTAVILFGRGEASASKRFFSESLFGIEPRQGNNYQGRVTLIRKSCYFAILFCCSCPRLRFLTKTNFSSIVIDETRRTVPPLYLANDVLELCPAGSEIQPFPFLPKKFLSDTFSRSALLDHRRMSINREI